MVSRSIGRLEESESYQEGNWSEVHTGWSHPTHMIFYISIIFILKHSFLTSKCKQNTDYVYHRKRLFHRNMTGGVLVNPITEVFLKKYTRIINPAIFIFAYCIFCIIFFVQHVYHLIYKVIFIVFIAIVYLLCILFDLSIVRLNM